MVDTDPVVRTMMPRVLIWLRIVASTSEFRNASKSQVFAVVLVVFMVCCCYVVICVADAIYDPLMEVLNECNFRLTACQRRRQQHV